MEIIIFGLIVLSWLVLAIVVRERMKSKSIALQTIIALAWLIVFTIIVVLFFSPI